jgi:soluble lytic murein transglycosylase-like protein
MRRAFLLLHVLTGAPALSQAVVGIEFIKHSQRSFFIANHQAPAAARDSSSMDGQSSSDVSSSPIQAGAPAVIYAMEAWFSHSTETIPNSSANAFSRAPAHACERSIPAPPRSISQEVERRRSSLWPVVRDAECRHGLPHGLLDSLVLQESRYQVNATSPVGASGLAQLMPATARALGVPDRYNPVQNVDGGARYLRQMLDRFGSVELALAAYNAGPGAVERYRGIPRYRETQGYVRSVMTFWDEISQDGRVATRIAQRLGFIDPIP